MEDFGDPHGSTAALQHHIPIASATAQPSSGAQSWLPSHWCEPSGSVGAVQPRLPPADKLGRLCRPWCISPAALRPRLLRSANRTTVGDFVTPLGTKSQPTLRLGNRLAQSKRSSQVGFGCRAADSPRSNLCPIPSSASHRAPCRAWSWPTRGHRVGRDCGGPPDPRASPVSASFQSSDRWLAWPPHFFRWSRCHSLPMWFLRLASRNVRNRQRSRLVQRPYSVQVVCRRNPRPNPPHPARCPRRRA